VILADSSVWIDHLRRGEPALVAHLLEGYVLTHPAIIGELALGQLRDRDAVLADLGRLPQATVATDLEVMSLIDRERLYGLGIGWVDAHLLAATRLTPEARLWTRDRRLAATAERLGLALDLYI
jgi:predicted nucleic acid-binding protein